MFQFPLGAYGLNVALLVCWAVWSYRPFRVIFFVYGLYVAWGRFCRWLQEIVVPSVEQVVPGSVIDVLRDTADCVQEACEPW